MKNHLTRAATVAALGTGLTLATSTGTAQAATTPQESAPAAVTARASSCYSIPTVRYGSSGYYVYAFQRIYNRKARNIATSYAYPQIRADGSFGRSTRAAAQRMQYQYNLSTDGVVGPRTWAKLTSGTCNVRAYM